jgi:hypothetical protein
MASPSDSRMKIPVVEQPPVRAGTAMRGLGRCALWTAMMLAQRRLHQPRGHVGVRCRFADGTSALVYRETIVDRPPPEQPAVLVVSFRLRRVRSPRAHALFRFESLLNTVLFAGFPGFVSKLWFAHDEHHLYRGLYDWDDPSLAESYVRALWWVLALVSVPASIHYAILPGLHRDELLEDPHAVDDIATDQPVAWWRLTGVEAATP